VLTVQLIILIVHLSQV